MTTIAQVKNWIRNLSGRPQERKASMTTDEEVVGYGGENDRSAFAAAVHTAIPADTGRQEAFPNLISGDETAGSADELSYCSFCGKSEHEVAKIIQASSVFVCDECLELCSDITVTSITANP
jgi:hypothetical protein